VPEFALAPDFVYVTYIAASPDAVWNALIDRELTKAYWQHYNASDWKPGSRWEHIRSDATGTVDIVGKVVEIDPPNRLVITWSSPKEAEDGTPPSKVTFEIQAVGPDAKLIVTHSDLRQGTKMHAGVTKGWPAVLSNLKTLLETGRTLQGKLLG
jgi:uncharacterized protein YndB with AHSA1/START domain